ncbi:MAG: PSD1 and planctomycete cytochrome C domain-containing protein [Pirellulaceae bacterium]
MKLLRLKSLRCALVCLGLLGVAFRAGQAATADSPDFNREVRPILSAHCFKCHGPDDKTREAGLRLDGRDGAIAALDSGSVAVVPGKPDQSELVRRVLSDDEGEVMPPPATNKPLSATQKNILRRWIAAGAPYAPHWAFVAPRQATLPAVKQTAWPKNPIDRFVLAKIEAAGLAPSPQADKATLIRRLYFDLLGLPPTPAEADAFVKDTSPGAYEQLVDRLLDSPHYGERFARRWLDMARYADTNGYEKDRVRSMWPYRDWVIRAINADMPFDQFTIEQLAGDMLPDATLDQQIATGFHRNTMINEEGGIDPLEFRYYASVDRINTTATVWLGLTLGCAQCHTHKFDPIPHQDYYRLMAFLNNANEPMIDVPQPDIAAQRAEIENKIAAIEADLANRFPAASELRWTQAAIAKIESGGGATAEKLDDGSVRLSGTNPDTDTFTIEFESDANAATTLRLEALTDPALPGKGPGRTPHGNFVLSEISISVAAQDKVAAKDKPGEQAPVAIASATADFSQEGFAPADAFDGKPKTGWAIHGPGEWNVNRTATFTFDKPVQRAAGTRWTIKLDQQFGGQHTLGRFRLSLGQTVPTQAERPLAERRSEHLEKQFAAWQLAKSKESAKWTLLRPISAKSEIPTLTIQPDGSVFASGDMTKRDVYDLTYDTAGLAGITAIRLEALTDDRLPSHGPGRIYYEGPFGDFFLSKVTLFEASGVREHPDSADSSSSGQPHREADASRSPMVSLPPANKFRSATHSFASGKSTAAMAIDDDPQTGWSINGGQGRVQWATFAFDQPLQPAAALRLQLLFERYYAAGLGRFKIWATTDKQAEFASDLPTEIENLLASDEPPSPEDDAILKQHFLATAPELAPARAEIEKLRKSLPEQPTTLVMQERPASNPRQTFIHHRGEFLQPKDQVEAGVLSILPQLPPDAAHDRLAFARWLVDPANPLVGRVTMNRQWAAFFGRGIVPTVVDFGYQGEPPTHPELIDWLAVELVNQDWSLKRMRKMIVMSATYQQSSAVPAEHVVKDPQNKLLAHAPRRRLDAEQVRDAALKISGLFSHKVGGPSVFPPQPASVTSEGAYGKLAWTVSEGADRYRRGLYTFTKRTTPYAMFQTFDGPSGEACVAQREVSNTPLQALTLLNDEVFIEAAQALGRQFAAEAATSDRGPAESSDELIADLFRRCLTREPTENERKMLAQYYKAQVERLTKQELDAVKIAGPGEGEAIGRAAWTLLARAILNLDETITRE